MKNQYESPLNSRYASEQMQYLFSPDFKFKTWRKLWIALAETEKELGLPISQEQIDQLILHQDDIPYDLVAEFESKVRHDVMAHVHAYGEQANKAKGIIHLGATSCYVGDNTDIIIMRKSLQLLRSKVLLVVEKLADFAEEYKALPTLGFTHFQAAQLVTVGKRATLWMQDLLLDLEELDQVIPSLKLLGCKGTTGTQASFLKLFEGDYSKVEKLDQSIAQKMEFDLTYPVSGQTYSRKIDARVLNVLSSIAQSAHKFSNDMRLLQHLKEMEEPFEAGQIGSSAMAYKRNPMRSERIAALARFVTTLSLNPAFTASEQWFERTLDDSANKRLAVPEAFLSVDAILGIYLNVASNLVVYPQVIAKHIQEELPFMATENIMMEAVSKGGDRQVLHEKIRIHSMAAGEVVKSQGLGNDLLDRIAQDPAFDLDAESLQQVLDPKLYIGCCIIQVEAYLKNFVKPILEKNREDMVVEDHPLKV